MDNTNTEKIVIKAPVSKRIVRPILRHVWLGFLSFIWLLPIVWLFVSYHRHGRLPTISSSYSSLIQLPTSQPGLRTQ